MRGGAGDCAGSGVDDEVVQGEPAGHGGFERGRFDQQPVSGVGEGGAQPGGGVSGIGQDLQRSAFSGEQVRGDGCLVMGGTGTGAQRDGGEQSGLRLDGQVDLVAVVTLPAALVDVAGLGIDGGDDPVGAVRRAIRHRPSVLSESSAGSTS